MSVMCVFNASFRAAIQQQQKCREHRAFVVYTLIHLRCFMTIQRHDATTTTTTNATTRRLRDKKKTTVYPIPASCLQPSSRKQLWYRNRICARFRHLNQTIGGFRTVRCGLEKRRLSRTREEKERKKWFKYTHTHIYTSHINTRTSFLYVWLKCCVFLNRHRRKV